MRNICFEKSCTKQGVKAIPKPFPKNQKLSLSLDQQPKVLYNLFSLYAKLRTIAVC